MMQKGEKEALSILHHYENTLKVETAKYNGEIVKTYGDGGLILFNSAVKAVQCAINIQQSLQKAPRVPLRIGLHIGEIVRKDHDIFGNGVNIASRIESMGVANSILISADVYNQVKNHPEFKVQFLGSFAFKNVERDIDLYAISNNGLIIPLLKDMKGKGSLIVSKFLSTQNKILVSFLAALIFVIGIIYKNSISNSSIYSGDTSSNLQALDFYLKGELHHKKDSAPAIDTAIVLYNNAIDKDPKFAKAYNGLASAYMRKFLFFDPDTKLEEEAYSAAGKALILDPKLANPHLIRGQFYWSQSHNFAHEEAYNEFNKAIEKDPSFSEAYQQLTLVQVHIGLFDKAIQNAQKSIDLDQGNYKARRLLGEALLFQGNYESSLNEFEKIPDNFAHEHTKSLIALNLIYLDHIEKAKAVLDENLVKYPNSPNLNSVYAIIKSSELQIEEANQLKKLAIEHSKDLIHIHHIYYHLAMASSLMNMKEEAVDWLIKAADTGFPNYPLFESDPIFENLSEHKTYRELLSELEKKWLHFKTLP